MSIPPSCRSDRDLPIAPSGDRLRCAEALSVHLADVAEPTEIRPGVSVRWGAVVHLVAPDGRAAQAGLLPGDVVLALNGRPIRDARQFVRAIDGCHDTRALTLSVLRRQDVTTIHIPSALRFDPPAGRTPDALHADL